MPEERQLGDLEQRVAATETAQKGFGRSLSELKVTVDDMRTGMERGFDRMRSERQPKFGVMIAFAGVLATVILGIVGIAGNGYIRDMDRMEEGQHDMARILRDVSNESRAWDAHHDKEVSNINSGQDARIAHNGDDGVALRDMVQREHAQLRTQLSDESLGRHEAQEGRLRRLEQDWKEHSRELDSLDRRLDDMIESRLQALLERVAAGS